MKKLLFALLVTTCAMNAFICSRPMFFLAGMLVGTGATSCFVEMRKPEKELKGMERLNFGKEQLKNFAAYCKDNGFEKLVSLLPEKSAENTEQQSNEKVESKEEVTPKN